MKCLFIRKSDHTLPTRRLDAFVASVTKRLRRDKILKTIPESLVIVFVESGEMRRLNKTFRSKDYATDVLSFDATDPESLGELVLCPEVIQRQAKEHELSDFAEYAYMVLHGILHLLGYDHEKDDKAAREMYRLQDKIFYSYFRGPKACQLQRKHPK
jgi:probable rRNA maturation factor